VAHSRYVDTDGNLVTIIFGNVTLDEIKGLQDELTGYLNNGELYELVIHKEGVKMNLNSLDAIDSADNLRKIMRVIKKAALAFVSDENFVFGLCRQLQIRSENDFSQICVFRTEDTARKWLNEMRSPDHTGRLSGI
jgi:hypothetical protein